MIQRRETTRAQADTEIGAGEGSSPQKLEEARKDSFLPQGTEGRNMTLLCFVFRHLASGSWRYYILLLGESHLGWDNLP